MAEGAGHGPSPEEIISALERTGFLFEQQAAQQLERSGFHVVINDAFPDSDTGKSRETDIFAFVEFMPNDHLLARGVALVECKNYSTPLVVVGRSVDRIFSPIDECVVSFDPSSLNFNGLSNTSIATKLGATSGQPNGQNETFEGHQLVRLDRKSGTWNADNSSIYDHVLYPLVKARENDIRRAKGPGEPILWEFPSVTYYFPVLLTAGEVYTVSVDEKSRPEVSRARWASISRIFHTRELRTTLRADVVSYDHFGDYLERRIIKTVRRANSILKEHENLYDPEWLLDKYGVPEQGKLFQEWLNDIRSERSL